MPGVYAQRLEFFDFQVRFQLPGVLLHSALRNDVVTIKHVACFVAADLHLSMSEMSLCHGLDELLERFVVLGNSNREGKRS